MARLRVEVRELTPEAAAETAYAIPPAVVEAFRETRPRPTARWRRIAWHGAGLVQAFGTRVGRAHPAAFAAGYVVQREACRTAARAAAFEYGRAAALAVVTGGVVRADTQTKEEPASARDAG